jgi:son of sevenless-like protein
MCTIVAALGATVIERLHLTWAHVEKKNQLAPLQRIVTPTGNYRECRDTLRVVAENGNPCVPFIGVCDLIRLNCKDLTLGSAMFLTELTHIAEQHTDIFSVPPSNAYPQGLSLINFAKRRTSTQVIDEIMKHQARTYQFPEKPHLLTFIEEQLKISEKDEAWFWQKTQELQQAEVAHADIKRNLEAAGF